MTRDLSPVSWDSLSFFPLPLGERDRVRGDEIRIKEEINAYRSVNSLLFIGYLLGS